MRASEPGESAILLPWLAPATASLVALARTNSPAVWPAVRTDPAAVLLLVRHFPPGESATIPDDVFQAPGVLETALRLWVEGAVAPVDWSLPDCAPIHQAALAAADLAERLARRAGGCDPVCGWIGGLLAPLGWLAVCAVDSRAAGDCLREPVYADQFGAVQRELWRLDTAAIARRLARRWRLPLWLGAIVGHLNADAETAAGLGADGRIFRVVQLAVLLGRAEGHDLGLPVGTPRAELAADLGLQASDVDEIVAEWRDAPAPMSTALMPNPALLPDLLTVAIEKRRLDSGPLGEHLEAEVDRLQEALAAQRAGEAARLHERKLRALAEFAAGAGHEINNPLAVISGHSQYLVNRETDLARQESLRAIIRQTERIHQILTELMQFARPPQPRRQDMDLRPLIEDVVAHLRPQADERGVGLTVSLAAERLAAHADPHMIRTALSCLVRNAIEAAPRDGWARLDVEEAGGQWVVAVEDSGPGPQPARREHMFDPFYSGRSAGRGRGLGLSTAWRLAVANGGDVRYEPLEHHPARFVLALPVCPRHTIPQDAAREELRMTA